MTSIKPKIPGLCSCCDRQIFEVVSQFPASHPYAGLPTKLGGALDNAVRVTLLTSDGWVIGVSVCSECLEGLDLVSLWKRLLVSWSHELSVAHRKSVGMPPLNDEQLKSPLAHLAQALNQTIIGVLATQRWDEIDA